MIALPDSTPLEARERHTLACLVDASGLLIAEGAARAQAVRLVLTPGELSGAAAEALLRAQAPVQLLCRDGELHLPRTVLTLAADILTRRHDGASAPRDIHGRPVSTANTLVRAEVERWPVLSLLARGIHDATVAAAGARPCFTIAPWPDGKRWAAALSHDLDVASLWPAFTGLRLVELAAKGDIRRLLSVLGGAAGRLLSDPIREGVDTVLDAEVTVGARSTWFIICGTPTFASFLNGDVTYSPESRRVKKILARLIAEGHEVGLHGSLETVRDGGRFEAQRGRLEALTGRPARGVRQHFLRRAVGVTERAMGDAGFAYDSTCGFADRNGFRSGLADVFPVWDESTGGALSIEEAPFCWMDRALSKYQGIEAPDRWIDDALELAGRSETVGGLWCGIWHPNLIPALGFPGAPAAYARLVRELSSRGAWLAPLDAVVRWRVARRSLRAMDVSPEGVPTMVGAPEVLRFAGASFRVCDRQGTLRATVATP